MIGNFLNSIGIGSGSVKVETTLNNNSAMPGEAVSGSIKIINGDISRIRGVTIALVTRCLTEVDGLDDKVVGEFDLAKIELPAHAVTKDTMSNGIPFSIIVPYFAPLSLGKTETKVVTRLDVERAIDPKDKDLVNIVQNRVHDLVFEAMKVIGCRLKEIETEYSFKTGKLRQEFDYTRPTENEFFKSSKINEVELSFENTDKGWKVIVGVDKSSFFSGSRERTTWFILSENASLSDTVTDLRAAVARALALCN